MSTSTTVYTEDARIHMPDIRVKPLKEGQHCEALRGHGFILAVFESHAEGEVCVGWVDVTDLGFGSAAEWAVSQNVGE